jgi:hypothetical protein
MHNCKNKMRIKDKMAPKRPMETMWSSWSSFWIMTGNKRVERIRMYIVLWYTKVSPERVVSITYPSAPPLRVATIMPNVLPNMIK